MPKEQNVMYTKQGEGWKYQATGTLPDGKSVDSSFVYAKDGEENKFDGFAYADAIVIRSGNMDSSTATFKRAGKTVGDAKRTLSKDGKMMTIRGNVTLEEGKKASYTAVYEKQ